MWRRVREMAHRAGLEVSRYPPRDPNPLSLEHKLRLLLSRHPVACVIDVGAHHGEFAARLRHDAHYGGLIWSFEPASTSFRVLSEKFATDSNWAGYQYAIGSGSDDVELTLYPDGVGNSLHGTSSLGESLGMREAGREIVQQRRLDDIPIPPGPVLIKADTQGHDLEVLRGADRLLSRARAVLVEAPIRNIYTDTPKLPDLMSALSDRFELCGLYPVLTDPDGIRVLEFDALFVARGASLVEGAARPGFTR